MQIQTLLLLLLLLHTLGARGELSAIQKPPTTFVNLWVKSATNLPNHDGNPSPTSEVYPHVYVSNDDFGLEKVYVWRTNSAESTPFTIVSNDPSWTEQDGTAVSVPLPSTGTIGVEFWDHDDTSQTDEFIGVTTIDIAGIMGSAVYEDNSVTSLSIPAPSPGSPTTATLSVTPVLEYGTFMLQILSGTNLINFDLLDSGESDVYVIVRYEGGPTLLTTATVDDNLNPVWPQQGSQVVIPKLPPTGSYVLEIWDDDTTDSEPMGTVTIPVSSILGGSNEGDHVYPVEGGTGELTVRINKAMYDNAPMVSVRVHGATGLNENMDIGSGLDTLPDPFLRMYVNLGTTAATRHQIFESVHSIDNNRNPTWTIDEASRGDLKLPVPGPDQEFILGIEILDSDHGLLTTDGAIDSRETLGWVSINVAQIMQGDPTVIGTHTHSVTDEAGNVNPSLYPGQLTLQIDPMYNFPACDRSGGKYRDLTSKACVSCGPGSEPEPVTATEADSTACVCTLTEQEWIATTNECVARCPDPLYPVWDAVSAQCVIPTSEPTSATPTANATGNAVDPTDAPRSAIIAGTNDTLLQSPNTSLQAKEPTDASHSESTTTIVIVLLHIPVCIFLAVCVIMSKRRRKAQRAENLERYPHLVGASSAVGGESPPLTAPEVLQSPHFRDEADNPTTDDILNDSELREPTVSKQDTHGESESLEREASIMREMFPGGAQSAAGRNESAAEVQRLAKNLYREEVEEIEKTSQRVLGVSAEEIKDL